MEAGLEHLSRGTGKHLSRFVAVLEPYYRSMETARRVTVLAAELGIPDIVVVANKVRDDGDRTAIGEFCAAHGMRLIAEVPFDPTLVDTERAGMSPVEVEPPGAAVRAIRAVASLLSAGETRADA